jgi:hypothetical protein
VFFNREREFGGFHVFSFPLAANAGSCRLEVHILAFLTCFIYLQSTNRSRFILRTPSSYVHQKSPSEQLRGAYFIVKQKVQLRS